MEPITLPLTIDLDAEIGSRWVDRIGGYDSDGVPYEAEGPHRAETVTEVIVDHAARTLVAGLDKDARSHLAHRVRAIRDETIRAAVEPLVAEAISGPITRTNAYGEPITHGEPTSLREIIVAEVSKQLTMRSNTGSLHDRNPTVVEQIVADQVQKALTKDLAAAVAEAKALVVGQVKTTAADMIAKAVAEGIRR